KEAEEAGARYILEEYGNSKSWVNSIGRSKILGNGEVVGIGASKEQMAQEWAQKWMLDIQHIFYGEDGTPVKLGVDWTAESKTIASKSGNKAGTKTPIGLGPMENSGRSLLDMIDKGIMPNNDELMTVKAADMPDSVIAPQMVASEKKFLDGLKTRGFHQMVGVPLHTVSREPMWLLHVHNGYKDAYKMLANRVGEVTDPTALDKLIPHGTD